MEMELEKFLEGYRSELEQYGLFKQAESVVKKLRTYSRCSSYVVDERNELSEIAEIISRVPLIEHTYWVLKFGLEKAKEIFRHDFEMISGLVILGCLCHDIGKIAKNKSRDHQKVGVDITLKLLEGTNPRWLDMLVEGIRNHHGPRRKSRLGEIIYEADGLARKKEVEQLTGLRKRRWEEWYDVKKVLGQIKERVNVVNRSKRWDVVSYGGVIYCQPKFLYEVVRGIAGQAGVIDIDLIRPWEREKVLMKAVEGLKMRGVVTDDVSEGRYGKYCKVFVGAKRRLFFLIPIKVEAVGLSSELESRKRGWLKVVKIL